jgi:hypothetical protein
MRGLRATALMAMPLRLNGISLGRAVDLLLDREELKVLGVEVLCRDGVHRFLPLATAVVSEEGLAIASPLLLLDEGELAFYRARARPFSSLRGRVVAQAGRAVGTLRDVVLAPDGAFAELIVDADGIELRLPFDGTLAFAPARRSVA